jgi:hypothetical protein
MTRNGFVSGASFTFVSGTKSGDYQGAMNLESFEHLVLTKILPNSEEPLLIVMGNASNHIALLDSPPAQSWEWTREENTHTRWIFKS